MTFQLTSVTSNSFTPLVLKAANQGNTLIVNRDANNTAWLTDKSEGNPATVDAVNINPGESFTTDGSTDIYGFCIGTGVTASLAIMPGGSAFFQPTILANIGGISGFVQNTMPSGSSHPLNSIWFQPVPGALYTWNGSNWVQQEFNASQLITAGTIVASLIAAGVVVAGIVNGTTITGAQIIADGTSGEFLAYSGVPAAGNMVGSLSPVPGTDSKGNAYTDGYAAYNQSKGSRIQIAVNQTSGVPYLYWTPPGQVHNSGSTYQPPQIYSNTQNAGAANEYSALWIQSGQETDATGTDRQALILLASEADNNTIAPFGYLAIYDGTSAITTILHWTPQGLFGNGGVLTVGDVLLVANEVDTSDPSVGPTTRETWHPMTLINSWTQAASPGATAQYRRVASPPNSIEVMGSIVAPAGLAGGSAFWNVPAGYQTNSRQPLLARNQSTNAVVILSCSNGSGQLSYQAGAVAGNTIDFHGYFSQDA